EARTGLVVGIDTGGTFTDFVVQRNGDAKILQFKVPSTPRNPTLAIEAGLTKILESFPGTPIRRLVHGTTVATNQLIQGRPVKVALITTDGFRDVLEIGRQYRRNL